MSLALQKYFRPVLTMNRRVMVGGGVLGLALAAESLMTFLGPLA